MHYIISFEKKPKGNLTSFKISDKVIILKSIKQETLNQLEKDSNVTCIIEMSRNQTRVIWSKNRLLRGKVF